MCIYEFNRFLAQRYSRLDFMLVCMEISYTVELVWYASFQESSRITRTVIETSSPHPPPQTKSLFSFYDRQLLRFLLIKNTFLFVYNFATKTRRYSIFHIELQYRYFFYDKIFGFLR